MASKVHQGELVNTFVALADTLVAGFDVVDLLHTLVADCALTLDASAAGILLLAPNGDLEVVASTSERSHLVELMQVHGPCIQSVTSGRAVSVGDIRAIEQEWPLFRAAALEQGFRSLHAMPLRLREETIGSLNLFWDNVGTMDEGDAAVAQALADLATVAILQECTIREGRIARVQLQHTLDSRVLIEQAKGVIAQSHDIDMDAAFALLRQHARDNQCSLAEVSGQVVERILRL